MRLIATVLIVSIISYGPTAFAEPSAHDSRVPTHSSERLRLDKLMRMDVQSPAISMSGSQAWSLTASTASTTSGPLFVQAVPGEDVERTPREVELSQRIRALQEERAQMSTAGPTAAIIGGSVATGVGFVTFLAVTIASCGFDCGSGPTEATAGIAGGVGLAGLVALGTGLSLRKKKRAQMSEIDMEIQRIDREHSEDSPRLGARIQLGEEKMLVLSLQY